MVPYGAGSVTVMLFVSILRECETDTNAGVGHDVLGMRGVGGVCEMCMARGGEWIRGLDLGFTNPVERREYWTCICVWIAVV